MKIVGKKEKHISHVNYVRVCLNMFDNISDLWGENK